MTKLDRNLTPSTTPVPIAVASLKILKGQSLSEDVLQHTRQILTSTRTLFDVEVGVIDALNPKSVKVS